MPFKSSTRVRYKKPTGWMQRSKRLDQSVPFDTTLEDAVAHCTDPEEHET